jgi:hypothetical protein
MGKNNNTIKNAIIILIITVLALACQESNNNNSRKSVTKTLVGQILPVKDFRGTAIAYAKDGHLLFRATRDTNRIVIYRIDDDSLRYVSGIINKGRGPLEFIYVEYSISDDTLYVSNSSPAGMSEIWGIPLGDIHQIRDFRHWKRYNWKGDGIMTGLSFAKYKSGEFIVAGAYTNTSHYLSRLDFNKQELHQYDIWPDDSTKVPLHSKQMVYMQSKLCSNNGKLLYSCLEGRYMFITKIGEKSLGKPTIIYSHLPVYESAPGENVNYMDDCEYGIFPYTTSKFIYAQLERSRKEILASEEYKGYPWLYMDEIEVYDWNGKFIANYRTDKPFDSFVVSQDDKYIYTLTMDIKTQEPMVMKYELPKM